MEKQEGREHNEWSHNLSDSFYFWKLFDHTICLLLTFIFTQRPTELTVRVQQLPGGWFHCRWIFFFLTSIIALESAVSAFFRVVIEVATVVVQIGSEVIHTY